MIEIRLLGQFSVREGGSPIEIRSRPAQALLAYLLLTPNTPHRREKLAGLLWPDSSDANSRSYLRKALWQIRKSLPAQASGGEEFFLVDDISIAFNASSDYWLDAAVLVARKPGDSTTDELVEAVAAYHGELLPGFYEEWVALERDHIEAAFDQKMNLLIDRLVEERRWTEVVERGERWIALGKAPEPAFRALMIAHSSSGDRAKVAAAYARCAESLEEELGVEPSKQTEDLYVRLMRDEEPPGTPIVGKTSSDTPELADPQIADDQAAPSDRPGHSQITGQVPHNLPSALSTFVGRDREMAEVHDHLDSSRLVTLTGPGGSGKTRLAIQIATSLLDKYPDGVWLVEFGSLSEPVLVPQEVSSALGFRQIQDRHPTEVLLENLANKQALLVFDNCEHLIQSCAELVEILLRGCPGIRVFATSREALGVSGELAWIVPTLTMPPLNEAVSFKSMMEFDAIRLFIERARLVRSAPAFELTEENSPIVARICQRLDGIPLAVELAAARLKALTVEQVAARLDDRFSLLTTGSRTALPRQQTLRATMDWSYDQLPENEKAMLRQLSVFAGGWTLEAAEYICGLFTGSFLPGSDDVIIEGSGALDMLMNLVEKSLIVVDRRDDEARYRMLETIRAYAREKRMETAEDTAIRDRHLEIILQLAEHIEPMLQSDQVRWFDQLEIELDNIRAAIDWSMASDDNDESPQSEIRIEAGLRLAGALGWFFEKRNRTEPVERLSQLLAKPQAAKQTVWRAKALNTAGFLNLTLGTLPEAERVLRESLVIGRQLGDVWSTSWALIYLGAVVVFQADYSAAEAFLKEGLALARELGRSGKFAVGFSLTFLGDVFLYREDLKQARVQYKESLLILRELKNHSMLAYTARRLGHLDLRSGELERATELFRESLLLNREVDHWQGIAACLAALAGVAAADRSTIRAAQLFGAAEALTKDIATPIYQADLIEYDRNVGAVHSRMNDDTIAEAWKEGQEMSLEDAIVLALDSSSAE